MRPAWGSCARLRGHQQLQVVRRRFHDLAALHDLQVGLGELAIVPGAEGLGRQGVGLRDDQQHERCPGGKPGGEKARLSSIGTGDHPGGGWKATPKSSAECGAR